MAREVESVFGREWSARRWGYTIYGAAVLVGLAVVLVLFERQGLVTTDIDPYYFGEMGKSLADGNGFEGFGSLLKRRVPLYPLVIAGIYLVFDDSTRAVLIAHCFMFAGTATLAYDIARRVFNLRTGVITGVLCIGHPMLVRYIPNLHLETQLTLLFTLTLWLMIRFRERPNIVNGVLFGIAVGATTLTKAVALVLPAVFIVGLLLEWRRNRPEGASAKSLPWAAYAVVFLSMGLTILPWTIRNYQVTGHFVPVSTGTSDAFLRGFIFSETQYITLSKPPYTDAENASNAYFNKVVADAGSVWEADDYETEQILNEEAKRRLKAEPLAVVRKTIVGIFTFWYQLTSFKNSLLALVLALGAWALAIVGIKQARRNSVAVWPLLTPILYLN
jgi:4-amino-4-deoxy-L-arabinose transferase-like glycosyltransferase